MKKRMKQLLTLAVLVLMFALAGCGSTLTTDLQIDDNFAGSRQMNVSISTSDYNEYVTGDIMTLAAAADAAKPDGMTFNYEETAEGEYVFHFAILFNNMDDYNARIASILGEGYTTEYNRSDSVFSAGLYFKENFSSEDLLGWFKTLLTEQGYVDSSDASYIFEYSDNYLTLNGTQYESYYDDMSIDEKTYIRIEGINIFTDINEDGTMSRKIELRVDEDDKTLNSASIEAYMESVKPDGAVGLWTIVEDEAVYTLEIAACTPSEMTTAMQKFSSSEASYVMMYAVGEKPAADTEETTDETEDTTDVVATEDTSEEEELYPFGYSTVLDEYIDFSAYASNSWNEVNTYYYVNEVAGKPSTKVYFEDDDTIGWDYASDTYVGYNYLDNEYRCQYNLVSRLNRFFVPSTIEVNSDVKSADKMSREFVFKFDEQFKDNEVELIEENLAKLFGDVVEAEIKNKKDDTSITMEFEGSVVEVDTACKTVFGDISSDIDFYKSESFGLKQRYEYVESIDFGQFLDYEFEGTIKYNGKMCGTIEEDDTYVYGDNSSRREFSGKKFITTGEGSHLYVSLMGYKTHPVVIIVICIFVVVLLGGAAVGIIFALKASKKKKEATPQGFVAQPGVPPVPPVTPVMQPVAPETQAAPMEEAPVEAAPEVPVAEEVAPEAPVVEASAPEAAPAAKFCKSCGATLLDGAMFCKECGTKVE